jgi:hypothetical protein
MGGFAVARAEEKWMNAGDRRRTLFAAAVAVSLALSACEKGHHDALDSGSRDGEVSADTGVAADGGTTAATAPGDKSVQSRPGLKAIAKLDPLTDRGTRGSISFRVTESGVDLFSVLNNCPMHNKLSLVLQAGSDCSEATLTGPAWDSPRGEGITDVFCLGIGGAGRSAYSRNDDAPKVWSIGEPEESNVLGHAVVALDAVTREPVACGIVVLEANQPVVDTPVDTSNVPLKIRAQIAGICGAKMLVGNNSQDCPNPEELVACVERHCEFGTCVAACADYLACTGQADDPCSLAFTCTIDDACSTCVGNVQQCAFNYCADQLACAAPVTPDGPCSQLVACCAKQGDMADSCLELVRSLEKFSGDQSCFGVMQNWDQVLHPSVPCDFDE